MRIRVDPRKVKKVEMRDGTRYPVGRNGWVLVDHPKHEAELGRFGAAKHDVAETGYIDPRVGFISTPGKACACGFTAWPWTATCPRCARSL